MLFINAGFYRCLAKQNCDTEVNYKVEQTKRLFVKYFEIFHSGRDRTL